MFRASRCLVGCAVFAIAGVLAAPRGAEAQFSPSLPFNPYNVGYQSFSYPTIVNPALPNQARLNLYAPPDQGMVSLDMPGSANGRQSTALADRLNTRYGAADLEYQDNLAARQDLYQQWMEETDPTKRAELAKRLAEVNESLRTASTSRRRSMDSPPGEATARSGARPTSTRRDAGRASNGATRSNASGAGSGARAPATGRPAASAGNRAPGGASSTGNRAGGGSSGAGNRAAARTEHSNPARPTPATGPNRPTTPENRPAAAGERDREMTPEEVLQRSLNLDEKTGATNSDGPSPSRFSSGGSRTGTGINRSRFGTGSGGGSRP